MIDDGYYDMTADEEALNACVACRVEVAVVGAYCRGCWDAQERLRRPADTEEHDS